MKLGSKTAAGVDICDSGIRMVALKQSEGGLEVAGWAAAPLPAGAIKDGNIENAAILAKALRDLKGRIGIRSGRAAAALYGRPAIMQIIDMPKQLPMNIRQFVQNEIRHYVAAPGKEVVFDYCAITSAKRSADRRVLTVTSDGRRMTELVRACSLAGLDVQVIEPPLLAYARAIYNSRVASKIGVNVLIAMLRPPALMLAVLRNQSIDFVRTKEAGAAAGDLCRWLAEEIVQVVQFYEFEVPGGRGKWSINIFADSGQPVGRLEEHIKSRSPEAAIEVRTIDDACLDTAVALPSGRSGEGPSPVAVGLAMRALGADPLDMKVNVVPPKVARIKQIKTEVLIAANVVAALFLIMILAVDIPALMTERLSREIAQKKQLIAGQPTLMLLAQHREAEKELALLSQTVDAIAAIPTKHQNTNWAGLLEDIGKAAPPALCVTNIQSRGSSKVLLEGLSMSAEAVQQFMGALKRSQRIASASLMEARQVDRQSGIIAYEINCNLTKYGTKGPDGS